MTGTGKILRRKQGTRHLLQCKNRKRKRCSDQRRPCFRCRQQECEGKSSLRLIPSSSDATTPPPAFRTVSITA
ncbi:MAG: 50S ribosomal protein L35 [Luteolibacter sp.]